MTHCKIRINESKLKEGYFIYIIVSLKSNIKNSVFYVLDTVYWCLGEIYNYYTLQVDNKWRSISNPLGKTIS